MQRTVLEILPLLSPPKHLSPMWSLFLQNFLQYLPRSESLLDEGEDAEKGNTTSQRPGSQCGGAVLCVFVPFISSDCSLFLQTVKRFP